jgi:guanosine-3',5'-bis(diphosphate) 3'-pyrophosphohydrolase
MEAGEYAQVDQRMADLRTKVTAQHPGADFGLVQRAYLYAREKHSGQVRKSGEPYIGHPVEVAHFAADLRMDVSCLCAALLHDVVEDTETTEEEIRDLFGEEIAFLVGSLTKISKLKFESKEHAQAENIRKLVIAMSQDIRVVLIKLADRLHNMYTLEHMSESGQQRIAQETLEIYAPIAHRLGIHWIKSQLEDAAFRYMEPDEYRALAARIAVKRAERQAYVERVLQKIRDVMKEAEVSCQVQGRPKHLYSVWRKMVDSRTDFENIYDLMAFRIVVDSKNACYEAIGIVHNVWKPVPGRFKDYIAEPKSNGYRSLHTVVIGPEGHRIEVQIRTEEMHSIAEYGVAAHVGYKEGRKMAGLEQTQIEWLRELSAQATQTADGQTFLATAKSDLFADEIFVLTPKATVVALPKGSTPVDFAYAIHTQVGDHCVHAMVNGRNVPLRHELKNGDVVQIITRSDQQPRSEWLDFAVSARARTKIRQYVTATRRESHITTGRALLSAELMRHNLRLDAITRKGDLLAAAELLKFQTIDLLLVAVGTNKIKPFTVVQRILPPAVPEARPSAITAVKKYGQKIYDSLLARSQPKEIVRVSGVSGETETTYARCCNAVPGDEIVGYVTRRGGIQIHTRECARRHHLDDLRLVDVAWTQANTPSNEVIQRRVTVRVTCQDSPGMLAEMSAAFTSRGVNITNAHCRTRENGVAHNLFEIMVSNSGQLDEAIRLLKRLKGVTNAERVHA